MLVALSVAARVRDVRVLDGVVVAANVKVDVAVEGARENCSQKGGRGGTADACVYCCRQQQQQQRKRTATTVAKGSGSYKKQRQLLVTKCQVEYQPFNRSNSQLTSL